MFRLPSLDDLSKLELPTIDRERLPKIDLHDLPRFDLPTFDLPRFDLPRFDLPGIDADRLPRVELPKVDLPALPEIDLSAELDRVADFVRDAAYVGIGAMVVVAERADERRRELTDGVSARVRKLVDAA